MYFWKIDELKEDIKNDQLSEKDKFLYLFIPIIFCSFTVFLTNIIPADSAPDTDNTISRVCTAIISIVGTFLLYKANGGKNGVDFLGRIFSLGFVLCIRLMALLMLILIGIGILAIISLPDAKGISRAAIEEISSIVFYMLFYIRGYKHLNDLKNL
jgi:hypothetical protein